MVAPELREVALHNVPLLFAVDWLFTWLWMDIAPGFYVMLLAVAVFYAVRMRKGGT